MSPVYVCEYCSKPVYGAVYEHMSGWYKQRGKGLNGLRLRKPSGRFACSTCILLLEAGGDPKNQQTLDV